LLVLNKAGNKVALATAQQELNSERDALNERKKTQDAHEALQQESNGHHSSHSNHDLIESGPVVEGTRIREDNAQAAAEGKVALDSLKTGKFYFKRPGKQFVICFVEEEFGSARKMMNCHSKSGQKDASGFITPSTHKTGWLEMKGKDSSYDLRFLYDATTNEIHGNYRYGPSGAWVQTEGRDRPWEGEENTFETVEKEHDDAKAAETKETMTNFNVELKDFDRDALKDGDPRMESIEKDATTLLQPEKQIKKETKTGLFGLGGTKTDYKYADPYAGVGDALKQLGEGKYLQGNDGKTKYWKGWDHFERNPTNDDDPSVAETIRKGFNAEKKAIEVSDAWAGYVQSLYEWRKGAHTAQPLGKPDASSANGRCAE